ncbi:MAG: HAMP domain-containing protein [Solirubrobacterales bacterium]|nr:HAMP domain-containing protein [Solirubrobacterales bacterium]
MRRIRSLSLRLRLSLAFVAIAALAVGLATLLSAQGLEPRLSDAAEARIARSTDRLAEAVAERYRRDGRWTEAGASDLEHLGLTTGLRLVILRPGGRPVRTSDSGAMVADALQGPGATSRSIVVSGQSVGTLHAAPVGGSLLSPADVNLRDSLDRLHMLAGTIAVAIALLVALLLAQTMSAPLRRIRSAAQRMERGDLEAKVEPGGDAEVRAVGHALNRLAETLEHEEQVRRASVADLAHELRTPVSGLLSRLEAAQDGVLADAGANLEAMHAEALRLARLLDDLDKLTAAERPGLLLEKRPVDLAAVVASEAKQMAASFAEKGVILESKLAPAEIAGDPDRLAQIVANLLSNALRYTESGGRVRLRVAEEEGRGVVLEVSDTGIGIDAEDLKHIFKRFWRADKSRSRTTGGTGIGLAIVWELVIAHGGRIDVESAPGRGSRFRVIFSLASAHLHENGRPASPDLQSSARS